ncbi:MAG: CerR family C-terminal domain-containing protein [Burkholderiales bacterium]|nr:MAG: CerR family C-terminal domain-containing protein [Burkholderiales bacterium]
MASRAVTHPRPRPVASDSIAPGEATRGALLRAATDVFLAHGFRAARVQDIAAAAGVRLSAISYHFGGKAGLYLAVLEHHAQLALARSPWPRPDPAAPIELRFRGLVDALVRRMLDPDSPSRIASLLVREAANPTDALDVMFERFTRPQAETVFALLRERFGPRTPRDVLAQVALSVVGQVMVYAALRPIVERLRPGFYQRGDGLDQLVEHVSRFSWAGIEAVASERARRTRAIEPRRGRRAR